MLRSLRVLPLLSLAIVPACLIQPQPASTNQPTYGSQPTDGATATGASPGDPASTGPDGATPAPAPTGPVSVTLVNKCRDTVPVFFGTKPRYGSGTQSSLSGNSRMSKSFQPGEMIWLTDASGSGLSSITIDASTREVETDCGSITAR